MNQKWKYWWISVGLIALAAVFLFAGLLLLRQAPEYALNACYQTHSCTTQDPAYVVVDANNGLGNLSLLIGTIVFFGAIYQTYRFTRLHIRDIIRSAVDEDV